jgi:hypothetical protein
MASILNNPLHTLLLQDFTELLSYGKILRAENLSKELTTLLGAPFYLSHFGLPHYPVQQLDAATVFVHLNPGAGLGDTSTPDTFYAQRWKKEAFYTKHGLSENARVEDVVNCYIDDWKSYAHERFIVKGEMDNFDYKQACFLLHWPESGIDLKKGDLSSRALQQHNMVNVLNQKLQLELFPYGSNSIATHQLIRAFELSPATLVPYIQILLDQIIAYPRQYVLFGSRVFQTLFRLYHIQVDYLIEKEFPEQKFNGITKNGLSFSKMKLIYKGQQIDIGIPHSFPRRDLPNAYEKMTEYGRLCANYFLSS